MKKIRKMIPAVLSLFMSFSLTACSNSSGSKTSAYVGSWQAVSYNVFNYAASPEDIGASTFELKKDGTCTIAALTADVSNAGSGTWKETDSGVDITYENEELTGTMNGNVLVVDYEGIEFYLTKDGTPAEFAQTPELQNAADQQSPAGNAVILSNIDDWYGNYQGTFTVDSNFGTNVNDTYPAGREIPVYGYIKKLDSGDTCLELFDRQDYNTETDRPFLSMYLELAGDHFAMTGGDAWIDEFQFTADDNVVSEAAISSIQPLTFSLYGDYFSSSSSEAESDGFYWSLTAAKN